MTDISPPRSPGYPLIDLEEAATMARRVHEALGTRSVDRETLAAAAKIPKGGRGKRVLAAIISYGLLTPGKGKVGLSPLAMKLLFGQDAERADAAREASLNPTVFKMLADTFNVGAPENGVVQYLCRNNFTPSAAKAAASTYLKTMQFAGSVYAANKEHHDAQDEPDRTLEPDTSTDNGTPPPPPSASGTVPSRKGEVEVLRVIIGGRPFQILAAQEPTASDWKALVAYIEVAAKLAGPKAS